MEASSAGSMGMGTNKDESITGRVWSADFTMLQPVIAWRAFLNLQTVYLFNFPIFGVPW
jgi:hypothetical protein